VGQVAVLRWVGVGPRLTISCIRWRPRFLRRVRAQPAPPTNLRARRRRTAGGPSNFRIRSEFTRRPPAPRGPRSRTAPPAGSGRKSVWWNAFTRRVSTQRTGAAGDPAWWPASGRRIAHQSRDAHREAVGDSTDLRGGGLGARGLHQCRGRASLAEGAAGRVADRRCEQQEPEPAQGGLAAARRGSSSRCRGHPAPTSSPPCRAAEPSVRGPSRAPPFRRRGSRRPRARRSPAPRR
jgi:hypothetical protein